MIIIILLLMANAFFVASEFSLVSVRHTRIIQLANDGDATAQVALKALEHIDKSIAAVQLGITIASIGLGWVGEATLTRIVEPLFNFLPFVTKSIATHSVAIMIAFALITLLHVVIGELMPKSVAIQYPEKTALVIARPMAVIIKLFTPFIFILNGLGNLLLRIFKIPPAHMSHISHSPEELNMIIDASYNDGILNETEKDMLQNVFKFSDIAAKQAMVPRPDMIAIDVETPLDEIEQITFEHQYTRYPVYEQDLDHVVGILHVKDLYGLSLKGDKTFKISDLLREPMLVPETVKMDILLRNFKNSKNQMAIVIDEFGGTSGLITLEDVLEEICGEVQDEFDEEEADIKQIGENEYIINAMVRVDELAEFLDVKIEEEEVDTVGGIVVKELDRIAEIDDAVTYQGLEFTVLEIDGARITKLKMVVKKAEDVVDAEVEQEHLT